MNLFFTSDTHFGHDRIREYCQRPFNSLEEMDNTLIKRWNERVKPDDMVIFLGDFCFRSNKEERGEGVHHKWKYYRKQLNGEIVFVRGNHDNNNSLNTKINSLMIEIGGKNIYCTHDPANDEDLWTYNLCGHVHEKWKTKKYVYNDFPTYIINVGVDMHNFYPVSATEIIETFNEMEKND